MDAGAALLCENTPHASVQFAMLITWWYLYLAARSIAEKCKYCCCLCVWLRVVVKVISGTERSSNVWDRARPAFSLYALIMGRDVREEMLPLVLLR